VSVGFLVGPGVLEHVDGLHAAAARIGVAVINTWGAKGVFRWDSPFHGGTAGLQARDFELAGLGDVDVLVTSGLDPDEVTSTPWEGRAGVIDVAPSELDDLPSWWDRPREEPSPPALYTELSAVVMPMYGDPSRPPARLRAMSEQLEPGTTVFAPPGLLGYWVARTWPTTVPGSVVVPARSEYVVPEGAVHIDLAGVDLTIPQSLLDVAGPVVAWPDLELGVADLRYRE
jgi:hypothetical protein